MRLLRSIARAAMMSALALAVCHAALSQDEKPKGKGKGKAKAAEQAATVTAEPAAAAPAAAKAAPVGDMEPLKLELPKPMFVGTPKNIRSENLEAPPGKRQPLMVPKGTQLLSAKKPVKSSDMEPIIGEIELITDGDKEGADGSYVELGPGIQWVQLDLQETCEVYAIVIWHYHEQARVYHDVVVRAADDPDFITNVQTLFNNDHDNSAGLGVGKDKEYIETNEGKLLEVNGVKTRYVRLYSNGNTSNEMNHYIEVEVFGRPAAK